MSGLLQGLRELGVPLDVTAFGGPQAPLPPRNYAWLEQRILPRAAAARGCDILHLVDNMGALSCSSLQVVTVHDLYFLQAPSRRQRGAGWKAWAAWLYRSRYFRRSLAQARKILCVSRWTAQALAEACPETFRRTVVARPGVGPPFGPGAAAGAEAARRKHGLGPRYVLVPAAAERRKNLKAAVQGWRLARARGLDPGLELALYGMDARELGRHWPDLPRDGPAPRVLGLVPDAELASLLAGAAGLLFPSLGEGVGFPALEAAACGCPVIAGGSTAVPEFLADAAAYTDGSAQDVSEKLIELTLSRDLAASLKEKGPARTAALTWRACAEAHWGVYRSCLAGGGPDGASRT